MRLSAIILRLLSVCTLLLFLPNAFACLDRDPNDPSYLSKPLSYWSKELTMAQGDNLSRRNLAVQAIRIIGPRGLPYLLVTLQESIAGQNTPARQRIFYAVLSFRILGERAHPAIPALINLLNQVGTLNGDGNRERSIVQAMSSTGPAVMTALAQNLENTNAIARSLSAIALGQLFAKVAITNALPALIKASHDPEVNVRWRVIQTLGILQTSSDKVPPIVRPSLLAALQDPEPTVRSFAITAVQQNAETTRLAVPQWKELSVHDPESGIRMNAAEGLSKIDDASILPFLIEKLKAPETFEAASRALRPFGEKAKDAIPPLLESLPDPKRRPLAEFALGFLNDAAIPDVLKLLKSDDLETRFSALRILLMTNAIKSDVKPALIEVIDHDPDNSVRKVAQQVLDRWEARLSAPHPRVPFRPQQPRQ